MANRWRSWVRKYKTYIFVVLLIFLTLRVIVPQLDDLRDALSSLDTANTYWMLLGLIVFFLAVPLSALQYIALALKPIGLILTLRVQMAVLFVSKLLPQSIGSISLNVYYLMKEKHTASQAAAVMTMDGITNGVAYAILMVVALVLSPISLDGAKGSLDISANLIIFAAILLLGAIYFILRSKWIHKRVAGAWKDLKTNFSSYKQKPVSVVAAGLLNGLASGTSIFVLWASAQAFGIDLAFSGALLAYTFGNIAATLIPTPGGIGAVEAGIYSGLVLVGVNGPDATLITLLYRLITYWIPIVPGALFFMGLRKDLLAGYKIR